MGVSGQLGTDPRSLAVGAREGSGEDQSLGMVQHLVCLFIPQKSHAFTKADKSFYKSCPYDHQIHLSDKLGLQITKAVLQSSISSLPQTKPSRYINPHQIV